MPKTIIQKVVFKRVPVTTLFNTYMDSKEHSASTGAPVKIQNKEGAKFSVHDNYATGKNLQIVRNRLIVQSWRASDWNEADEDSTFILLFEQKGADGVINVVHANVPDKEYEELKKGWIEFYWKPWKKYFSQKAKK